MNVRGFILLVCMMVFMHGAALVAGPSDAYGSAADSTIYREDFEAGQGLWRLESLWAIGTDTQVPAHGGTYLAGTVLNGNVPVGSYTTRLISPAIALPSVASDDALKLQFWYWLASDNSHGEVQVQVDSGGSRWGPWVACPDIYRISTGWFKGFVEMSRYAGKRVRLGFTFVATSNYYGGARGWYVDDIEIVRKPASDTWPLSWDFEGDVSSWYSDNALWQIGQDTQVPAHGGSRLAGTVLNGNVPIGTYTSHLISPAVTLPGLGADEELYLQFWHRFIPDNSYGQVHIQVDLGGGQWGPWIVLPGGYGLSTDWVKALVPMSVYAGKRVRLGFAFVANSNYYGGARGWYIDDIDIVRRKVSTAVPPLLWSFEGDVSEWSTDLGLWQIGNDTQVPAHGGSVLAGTVLNGSVPVGSYTTRLISPGVTLPGLGSDEELRMRFWYWLAADNSHGEIQVQVDSGAGRWGPWKALPDQYSISTSWFQTFVDLSGYAGKRIRVGFSFVATSNYYGGARGWYIDDIEIFSTKALPPAPVPISPVDSAQGVNLQPTLTWQISPGANIYKLQLSQDPSFAMTTINDSSLLVTSKKTGVLSLGTTWYWRVAGKNQNGTGPWSETWTFTIGNGPPVAPTLLTPPPDTIGLVVPFWLTWSNVGAAKYHVQIIDSSFTTYLVSDSTVTGTSRVSGSLNAGQRYNWRVRGKNDFGWGSWSSVQQFRIVGIPEPPILASPSDNAQSQPTQQTFSWYASAWAKKYVLQVTVDYDFATVFFQDTTTGYSLNVSGLAQDQKYYWRVRSTNDAGWSAVSDTWSFRTVSIPPPASPVLLSPATGLTDVPATVNLRWNASPTATSYHVLVALDSLFAQTAVSDTALADTIRSIGPLSGPLTYYWKVRARNAGGYGSFSEIRSFTTLAVAPFAPVLTTPANNSTNQPVTVTLRWRPSLTASSYRLQVASDTLFASLFADDSTLTDTVRVLGPLAHGTTYYWRVCAANGAGAGPYTQAWKFTTIVAAPDRVTLLSPLNGETGTSASPVLRWRSAPRAATYRVQVATDSLFTAMQLNDSTVTDTSRQVGPLNGLTRFYWRTQAKNAGGTAPVSETWSFTTIQAPPSVPVLVTPLNSATAQPLTIVLRWRAAANAMSYRLQLAADSLFTAVIVDDSTLTDTLRSVGPLTNGQRYFWRVLSANTNGPSAFAAAWNFTTIPAVPQTPSLLSPANGVTSQAMTFSLRWTSVAGATQYRLQMTADSTFSTLMLDDSTITDTSRTAPSLSGSQKYFWRVAAKNAGGTSAFTPAWHFTTVPGAPAVPVLASPGNGSTSQPTALTLTWNAVAQTSTYRLQLATDSLFASMLVNDSTLTGTTYQAGPLNRNQRYFWRVSAKNAGGVSGFSATWAFNTIPNAPAVPALLSPANGTSTTSTTLALRWNRSTGATTYRLQLSVDSLFASFVVDDSLLTDTTRTTPALSSSQKYFWRVAAKNTGGASAFSPIWSFMTASPQAPAAPSLASPANGSQDQSTSPLLSWGASTGATAYHVQISMSPSFLARVANDSTLTTTSYQATGLANNTRYYWRVAAKNANGKSAFTSAYTFTTISAKSVNSVVATFPANPGSSTDYRLVSFPGASGFVVNEILAGAQSADWRIFRDNGGTLPDNLTEMTGMSTTSVGEGYWLLAKGSPGFARSVTMPALDSTGACTIGLRSGWNIIGNPLDQNVNWSAVRTANGLSTVSIFSYQGALGFQLETVLAPFGGYYFYNGGTATTLRIPYPYAGGTALASVRPAIDWQLQVAYASDINRDEVNFLGISPASSADRDDLDEHKPPYFMDQGVVCFMRPGWDSTDARFMSDYRPSIGTGQAWDFQVINPRLTEGRLRLLGVDQVPAEYDVVLVDLQNSQPRDLRLNAEYAFRSVNTAMGFRLLVGGKSFVAEELVKTLPTAYRLDQNYPNPFNPSTSISYALPKDGMVRLEVFSLIGERVAILAEGVHRAGVHTVVWDPGREGGHAVASGVYLYRLSVDGKSLAIRKMVLLK